MPEESDVWLTMLRCVNCKVLSFYLMIWPGLSSRDREEHRHTPLGEADENDIRRKAKLNADGQKRIDTASCSAGPFPYA